MPKNKLFGIIVFIVLTIFAIYSVLWKESLRKLPQRYVVGTINRISKSASSGFQVDYSYKFENQEYNEAMGLGYYRGKVFRDERYIVSIPEGYPENGLMLLECSVKPELEAPEEGWSKIPIECRP